LVAWSLCNTSTERTKINRDPYHLVMRDTPDPSRLLPLRDAGLDGEEVELFKADARSRVWRVDTDAGPRVVKRFEYRPLRQRGVALIGLHPAQIEVRRNRAMQRDGVPVVPVESAGAERCGIGIRSWIATPFAGTSLQHRLATATGAERAAQVDTASRLTIDLIRAGYTFKDLKPSNIVVDDEGRARLIDVGCARRSVRPRAIERMLAVMLRVLSRDGVDEGLRRRFEEPVRRAVAGGGPEGGLEPLA
jgi:hypothetical protein